MRKWADIAGHLHAHTKTTVAISAARAIVCIQGQGTIAGEAVTMGDTILLPACLGRYDVLPQGSLRLLECGVV